MGKATGLDINLMIADSGLLMTVTVVFGISALAVLSVIAVPAIACLGGYSVWLAVNGQPHGITAKTGDSRNRNHRKNCQRRNAKDDGHGHQ